MEHSLRRRRGFEVTVERTGNALFAVTVLITALFFGSVALWEGVPLIATVVFGGFMIGVSAVTGFVYWLIFRGLAEHLRLQKHALGEAYGGGIGQPTRRAYDACSACAAPTNRAAQQCTTCGEAFERATGPGSTTA